MSFDRLVEYQERVSAILDRAGAMLQPGAQVEPGALAQTRWELTRALREYQLFKHNQIFDRVIAAGDSGRAVQARALKRDCLAMGDAVRDYVLRWSSGAACARPEEHRQHGIALIARLRRHLMVERAGVAALFGGEGRPISAAGGFG